MKTCARCGKNWPDSTVQCPEDGTSLEAVPEAPRADEQAGEGNSPRSRIEVPLEGDRDEGMPETVVRARRALPIPPPTLPGARVLPG